jgi:hypothetical protein
MNLFQSPAVPVVRIARLGESLARTAVHASQHRLASLPRSQVGRDGNRPSAPPGVARVAVGAVDSGQ